MSEFMFLVGPGHLPDFANEIAEQHGVTLVNHHDDECLCGHGCPPRKCPASKRHWFEGPNRGEMQNTELARAVEDALTLVGILPPRPDPFTVRIRLLDATSPNELSRSVYIVAKDATDAVHVGMRAALAHGGRHLVEVYRGHHGYFSPDERLLQVTASWDFHTDVLTIKEGGAS